MDRWDKWKWKWSEIDTKLLIIFHPKPAEGTGWNLFIYEGTDYSYLECVSCIRAANTNCYI